MTLCMTDLGLRLSEVTQLSIEDLDWRKGTLRLPKNKSGRERLLPLPARLGRALASYLRRGRPSSVTQKRVFLCHHFPWGTPLRAGQVRYAIQKAYVRGRASPPRASTCCAIASPLFCISKAPILRLWPICSVTRAWNRPPSTPGSTCGNSVWWPCLGPDPSHEASRENGHLGPTIFGLPALAWLRLAERGHCCWILDGTRTASVTGVP
jgi:Phage integrase family